MAQATELWKTQPLTVTHVAGGYRDWGLAHLIVWCAPTKLVAISFIDIETPNQHVANAGRVGIKGAIY